MDRELFGDYYCQEAVSLAAGLEPLYMADPEALRRRDPAAIQALFEALLLTGVGMTMAGTSAPASGGEHLISHTLDMLALRDHRPHDLHGRQVGIGTVLALELYRRVLALDSPQWTAEPGPIDTQYWGSLSAAVNAEYDGKRKRYAEAGEKLSRPGAWDLLRGQLRPMLRPAGDICDCLRRANAAWRAEHIGRTRDEVRAALLHARQMRSRFTILDLAFMTGVLPGAAGEIVEQWA
jgi:glycerol-1-phosphate dehydrogenase [NAD(P)+]